MSSQDSQGPLGGQPGAAAPSEEELRAAYEAELSRISVIDMISQAAVSLLNIAARRLAPAAAPGEARDLEQVRDGIDAVRALLEILERRIPQEVRPLRDALSQLQMAYAAEVRSADSQGAGDAHAGAGEGAGDDGGAGEAPTQPEDQSPGPGPAQSSGRLWVPGS
jgi:hypothetical protein